MDSTTEPKIDSPKSSPPSVIPRWIKLLSIGAIIRFALKIYFPNILMRRVELVSPLTSWYRMQECIALSDLNSLPYSGDICHHPPLLISFFRLLHESHSPFLFIIADAMVAVCLYLTASKCIHDRAERQEAEKSLYSSESLVLLFNDKQMENLPVSVMLFYLFNPFSILTCQAQSTEVINNLALSIVLVSMVNKKYFTACLFVAVSAYLSLYPVMLLAPVLLHAVQNSSSSSAKIFVISKYIVVTTIFLGALMSISYFVYESWSFIDAVYGFILKAPDLTPNMGLFWYFFSEMFDHFRLFFLWVYQLNVFIYLVPVAIIFRKHPVMVFYVLLSTIALFKSYSNIGSLAIPLALLPIWSHLFRYMRNVLLVSAFLLVSPILIPGMWYLWIYAGSGNANFFYAVTLAYGTGQVFLLSDISYAFLRYEFHLFNGLTFKTKDGKDGIPVLK